MRELQRRDERPAKRLLQAKLEDGAPQPLHRAPECVGGFFEGLGPAVLRGDLGDLDLLQSVDDVLEYVIVEVASYPVALGLPRLVQRLLGLVALG